MRSPTFAYFVHDLTDPAVLRRTRMLRAGGATVHLVGFTRRDDAPEGISLGKTFDANLKQRLLAVLRNLAQPWRLARLVTGADVIMARNLEMLVLALVARGFGASRARLVFESLDIHKMMLGAGLKARAMRFLEHAALKRCDLLIVSSNAFLAYHFSGYGRLPRTLLVENRLMDLDDRVRAAPARTEAGAPWRIGWFGMIRCRRSLAILMQIASDNPNVEIVIRGKPTAAIFPDLSAEIDGHARVRFLGPYVQGDLAAHYADVDLVWAIDFYEEGQNSAWLLPNRIYEGAASGRPILALSHVETGRWVDAQDAGATFDDLETELPGWISRLTPADYADMVDKIGRIPRAKIIADAADCRELVEQLSR